ncbi:CHAD domain-containing protein [Fusibacter ferrireducens]|uniref:CHAD domain-containing protein n=1 Tax=Fusibacter ferrireducens TaxID=2785058 RepID=A0ABR9ZS81_9FIRM|nr:CHAD domain-containing protein [Fusibacter ferrireducens]MBF4693312.1 CHAD domain-containing protein [Fusibacter ferrireducens]
MRSETRISQNLKKHLKDIDLYFEKMIESDFSHKGIHEYRESIRRFRAILFFYEPFIKGADYVALERISKKHFDATSLIRELDVFEEGYGHVMNTEVISKMHKIKAPLKEKLRADAVKMKEVDFSTFEIHIKQHMESKDYGEFEQIRQAELFEVFVERSAFNQENVEKSIHAKRMLAKKIRYVHCLLMPEREDLKNLNDLLDAFQIVAKALHDVCVNLRFIGHYELDDQILLDELVKDHAAYLKEADDLFESVREAVEGYLAF